MEITDRATIEEVICQSSVCRLALSEDNRPYLIPLCFGYKENSLYFHSAREGKKIQILKKNNRVCFEFDINSELVKSQIPCKWGMKYMSVIGFGNATFVEDYESKRRALDIIMHHYSGKSFTYDDQAINGSVVIKVKIEHMTGKRSLP